MKPTKRQFIVSLVIPPGVTVREMAEYIRKGICNESGLYDAQYPITALDRKTVTVKSVKTTPRGLAEGVKPECFICGSKKDLRKFPLATRDSFDKPCKRPICMKCLYVWYDEGITDVKELREYRRNQDAVGIPGPTAPFLVPVKDEHGGTRYEKVEALGASQVEP